MPGSGTNANPVIEMQGKTKCGEDHKTRHFGFVDPPSDDEGEKKVSGVRRQSGIAKQRAKRQSIKQQKEALGKLRKKRSEAGGQTGEVYRREVSVE